jgi:hypothetical protein
VLARPRDLDRWVASRCGTKARGAPWQFQRAELDHFYDLLRERIELGKNLRRASELHMAELQTAIQGLCREISGMHSSSRSGPASC